MKSAAAVRAKPESGRASGAEPFFSKTGPAVQAKLSVSTPGEKLEREADGAADAVVHGRGPMARSGPIGRRLTPIAQRAPEDEAQATEEDLQRSGERASDPGWDEHEPVLRSCPPPVEDEPLHMKAEDAAQAKEEDVQAEAEEAEAGEEVQSKAEEVQAKEEDVQKAGDEEAQAKAEEPGAGAEQVQEQSEGPLETEAEAKGREAEEEVQMRGSGAPPARPSARAVRHGIVERQLRASRGRGNPLPEPARRQMEAGLAADFSSVRIHTDAPAFVMTRLLRAKAFTSGRDIFFSPHRYAPGTQDGDHLLAHELAHTLQQGAIETQEEATAQRVEDEDRIAVRPESLAAIRIAREQIGRINSKLRDGDGNRVGWERLLEIFRGAFGGDVIAPALVKRAITSPDQLPHWCGIFAWWALKKAGLPLPDWKPGARMLEHTEQRPAGELPKKGDIAYRTKLPWMPPKAKLTHHQAIVSGVESAATAEGKPFKSVEVRTVDGNTAGTDNLGGQVEEKWQPIGDWTAFFDPTGKVPLPEVPLVETDRASDDAGPAPEAEAAEPAPEEVTEEEREEALAAPPVVEPEALPGPGEEVAVELPPPVEAEPEAAAEVEELALEGASEDAMTSFVDASPSRMAASAPALGPALDEKTAKEKKTVADEAPDLVARTGGEVDPGITRPEDLPVPADTTLDDKGLGPEVGKLDPEPYEEKGTAPSTEATRAEMRKQPEGGFLSWLTERFTSILNSLRTSDDSVNTSAGTRKRVALTGDADVGRMERQRQAKTQQLRGQRDEKVAAFKGHPGQSNIQPRRIDEAKAPPVTPETAEPIPEVETGDGPADYAGAELPKAVRDAADAKMAPTLHGNLGEARAKATEAASTRDAEKDAEIAEAERRTAEANRTADEGQRKAVLAGRTDVARQQGEAIGGAYAGVAEFAKDAGKRQGDERKAIGDDVKAEEGKADKTLEDGEKKAREIKREQEAKARAKKAELKKKKEEQGLFDRAVGFVKDVVNTITEAIDDIFNALRTLVKDAIDAAKKAAIGFINAARDAVIGKLNDFRDWAKDKVDTYVKDRFPGLANALNKGIDATVDVAIDGVNAAADAAVDAVEALADALGKALDRILAAFQAALKAAVRIAGAVLTGDFAAALRIAIEAACEIAGIDPQPIFRFMERAGNQLTAILKSPGKFINNVLTAVGMGVRGFVARIKQHLMNGLIEWLTGALSAVPITLPEKWDIKGIFSLVAQILGVTYENIKARIIKKYPKAAKVFDLVEKGFALIRKLVDRDYGALWEEVKAKLATLKETVIGGIRNWVTVTVIKEGIIWLLSLLNPASALAKALKLLFDLVMWLIERYEQIKAFVTSVYTAVTNIAAGVLGPAAKAVEGALSRSVPVVISMLASAIGLGGIGEAVKGVLEKITRPINKVIDALVDKVVAFAKKLWGKAKKGAKKVKEKIKAFLWPKKKFSVDGENHTLYFKGKSGGELYVASTPRTVRAFLRDVETQHGATLSATEKRHLKDARAGLGKLDKLEARINARIKAKKAVSPQLRQQMVSLQDGLARHIRLLIAREDLFAASVEKYKLEGFAATFRQMPRATRDFLTPDHQPQAATLKFLVGQKYYQRKTIGAKLRERAGGKHADGGWTINLSDARHKAGRTYGPKGAATSAAFKAKVKAIEKTKPALSAAEQRERAIGYLKIELDEDVAAMGAVYARPHTDAVWNDLTTATGNAKQKKQLAATIRKQVRRGESQLKSQPMAELTK